MRVKIIEMLETQTATDELNQLQIKFREETLKVNDLFKFHLFDPSNKKYNVFLQDVFYPPSNRRALLDLTHGVDIVDVLENKFARFEENFVWINFTEGLSWHRGAAAGLQSLLNQVREAIPKTFIFKVSRLEKLASKVRALHLECEALLNAEEFRLHRRVMADLPQFVM